MCNDEDSILTQNTVNQLEREQLTGSVFTRTLVTGTKHPLNGSSFRLSLVLNGAFSKLDRTINYFLGYRIRGFYSKIKKLCGLSFVPIP